MDKITQAVLRLAEVEGDYISALPQLSFHSRMHPVGSTPCMYHLGIGLVLQGKKEIVVGDQLYRCDAGQSMLTTMDLPVTSHIVQASPHKPFLAVLLLLDLEMVNQVVADLPADALAFSEDFKGENFKTEGSKIDSSKIEEAQHAFSVSSVDMPLIDAFLRLIQVLDEPLLMPHLAPLIQKEIIVRVLNSPQGIYLRQLVKSGSSNQKIHQVVNWLKHHYVQPIRMDDLADQAFMSPSTFRQHFREITGMSPLQYQKQLRLQEARHLMLNQKIDAGRAAGLVGYESASQFSREYSRLFGESPQRDIQRMRQSL
ncbi:MAG: AraC family transcriptional regulator [Acinetobacter sp.]